MQILTIIGTQLLVLIGFISTIVYIFHSRTMIETLQDDLCRIATLTLYKTDVLKRVLELAPATESYLTQAEREIKEERGMPQDSNRTDLI